MGMTTEQLVEYALIESFPGQSQNQKQAYRYEFESFVPQALLQLAREVAASPDYQMLQRSVVLPVLATREIDYDRFGPEPGTAGKEPIIDNGIVFGDTGAFAISPQRLTLSGSPLRVRSQFLEWQYLTVTNGVSVGVIPLYATDLSITTPADWEVLVKVSSSLGVGEVWANGVRYTSAFPTVIAGDFFQLIWDANGDLTINQLDANRTLKLTYTVLDGDVTQIATPGVVIFGNGGQVTVGRVGTGSPGSTPSVMDGLYRLDLQTGFQFLTSYFDENGMVQFDGTTKLLSWVPSLSYRGQAMRCDSWYWTFDGEQIVFWPGSDGETLPSNSLRITGSFVPEPPDLPFEYHKRAIDLLVEKARVRGGMRAK
jgi:hypothetical protein